MTSLLPSIDLPRPGPAADAGPLDARFYDLVEARVRRLFVDSPVLSTYLGIHDFDHLLGDPSGDKVREEIEADRDAPGRGRGDRPRRAVRRGAVRARPRDPQRPARAVPGGRDPPVGAAVHRGRRDRRRGVRAVRPRRGAARGATRADRPAARGRARLPAGRPDARDRAAGRLVAEDRPALRPRPARACSARCGRRPTACSAPASSPTSTARSRARRRPSRSHDDWLDRDPGDARPTTGRWAASATTSSCGGAPSTTSTPTRSSRSAGSSSAATTRAGAPRCARSTPTPTRRR